MSKFAAILFITIFGTTPTFAAQTKWLSPQELGNFMRNEMAGNFYATAIKCKPWPGSNDPDWMALKVTYKAFNSSNPFYKWSWVGGKEADLARIINKIKLKSKPELKYRIVNKSTFTAADGTKRACAILYR